MTARNGSAEWHGNVQDGAGTVTVGNGVFPGAYSCGLRFGEEKGTNPEELIAARSPAPGIRMPAAAAGLPDPQG